MPGDSLEYASEGGAQDLSQRLVRVWISLCGVAMVTFLAYRVIPVNMTTAGFAYLLLVLVFASTWGFLEAAVSSIFAALAFDYFFVPPILGFTPSKSEDWIALLRFAATSRIAGHLSTTVKRRTSEVIRAEEALPPPSPTPTPACAGLRALTLMWKRLVKPRPEWLKTQSVRLKSSAGFACSSRRVLRSTSWLMWNEVIREIIVLLSSEATRYSVSGPDRIGVRPSPGDGRPGAIAASFHEPYA